MVLNKKRKPKFNVMNLGFFKSVKARWRKPRGIDNKKRIRKKFAGASPHIGYRNPILLRSLHPLGKEEVLVKTISNLDNIKDKLVRISATVGGRKKLLILEKAKQLKLEVLNPAAKKREVKLVKGQVSKVTTQPKAIQSKPIGITRVK